VAPTRTTCAVVSPSAPTAAFTAAAAMACGEVAAGSAGALSLSLSPLPGLPPAAGVSDTIGAGGAKGSEKAVSPAPMLTSTRKATRSSSKLEGRPDGADGRSSNPFGRSNPSCSSARAAVQRTRSESSLRAFWRGAWAASLAAAPREPSARAAAARTSASLSRMAFTKAMVASSLAWPRSASARRSFCLPAASSKAFWRSRAAFGSVTCVASAFSASSEAMRRPGSPCSMMCATVFCWFSFIISATAPRSATTALPRAAASTPRSPSIAARFSS
jgi:hypothetical protein